MNPESYQNQDQSNLNPLQPDAVKSLSLPKDPKIIILIILGIIVVILLIASLFVNSSKRTPKPPARINPTPTANVTPLPTEKVDVSSLPENIKKNLDSVDNQINSSVNFDPPQIDTEIGL